MANVKISNLPVETTLANMTGIAGYNAAGTAQISGATIDGAFAKSNSDLQFIVDNGNIIDSNAGTGTITFTDGVTIETATYSNTSIQTNCSFEIDVNQPNKSFDVSTADGNIQFVVGGVGKRLIFNTPEIDLTTASLLDSTGQPGSAGEVLSSLGAGNGTEWVAAGGPTPGIGDVLSASQNTNSGQKINFIDGGTVAEISTSGIFAGGNFSIVQGGNDLLVLGSPVSPTNLPCGAGQISLGDTGNNINISTNGSDKIQLSVGGTGEVEFYLGLNNTGPAIGDVLTAKSTSGAVEWTTPSTPNLDISNIDANTIKADLTQSSQPQYGQAIVMEANGAIANGEPVIWDYTSGVVTARTPTSSFTQQDAVGVALEDIANGASGKILISGFATVKWDGVVSPPVGSEIVLDNSSNGTSIPLSTSIIPFRSVSGGTGSYPSSAGPWTIKFDAGVGNTVKFEIVDFEFEHGASGSPMYDRGGWVVSPDNNTYSNAQLTPGQNTSGSDGWLTSATSTVGTGVWSSSLGSSSSTSGYIFPENPTVGNVNIGDVIDLGERFAEYHFRSDGSSNFLGWDLKMFSSGLNPAALTIGQTMQADINSGTFNRLTGYQPGAPIYGYFIGGSTANNAVVCRIAPPRPVS